MAGGQCVEIVPLDLVEPHRERYSLTLEQSLGSVFFARSLLIDRQSFPYRSSFSNRRILSLT